MANARASVWIAVLVAILLFAARGALRTAPRTNEYAYGCDSFGFMTQAARVREAVASRRLPDFHIETRQTRLLIDDLRSRRVPRGRWDELVAPHAHHYMRGADRVGVQYPPGTAIALAAFPAGRAVAGLARSAIAMLAVTGTIALLFAGARRAAASASLVLLAIVLGFDVMVRLGARSFSIFAVVPALLVAAALAAVAAAKRDTAPRVASLAALAAGGALGFAVMTRIPSVLLLPGFLLLLLPRWLPTGSAAGERSGLRHGLLHRGLVRRLAIAPLLSLLCGVALFGVAPVLLNQQLVAGSWRMTTYGGADASLPRPIDAEALRYYLGGGEGSGENWVFLPALLGLAAAIAVSRRAGNSPATPRTGLTWPRVLLAGGALWATSTVFFLTHVPRIPYYNAPGVFAAMAVVAFGALAIEASRAPGRSRAGDHRAPTFTAAGAVALALLGAGAAAARSARLERLAERQATPPASIELPAELADERAWIWADELTGTFWYYARKPAFKVAFGSDRTRAEVFRFVRERGEPQYVVRDSPALDGVMREIESQGGVLEPRGTVVDVPYFAVRWPDQKTPTSPK